MTTQPRPNNGMIVPDHLAAAAAAQQQQDTVTAITHALLRAYGLEIGQPVSVTTLAGGDHSGTLRYFLVDIAQGKPTVASLIIDDPTNRRIGIPWHAVETIGSPHPVRSGGTQR